MSRLIAWAATCCAGMLALLLVPFAAAQSPAPYPAWRAGLPLGVFTAIPGTAQMSGQTANPAVINAWNGLAPCGSTWLSMLSGGHTDSSENRVYALDLAADAPVWVTLHRGSAVPTPTNTLYYADGLPASRHTYYSTQCVASRNRVMTFGVTAANVYSINGTTVDGFDLTTRAYDPAGTWPNVPFFMQVSSVAADPRTGDAYVAGNWKFAKWTAATSTWSSIVPVGIGPWAWSWEFKGSFIDIKRNKWINQNVNLLRLDLVTSAADTVTITGPLAGRTDDYSSTVHDTDNDRYLTIKGTTLYAIDPDTGSSTALASVPAAINGVNNRIAYFPSLGGVAYLPTFASNVLFMPTVADPLPQADSTPPTVAITSPAGGETLSGTVTITAAASDDTGVAGVQFALDGSNLGAESTAAPFAVAWSTSTIADGTHFLTALARDAAGNTTTSAPVSVVVHNAPPPDTTAPVVTLTAPADGATVAGTVAVAAGASDNVGVAGVQFKLDGANLGAEVASAPYTMNWDTTGTANGEHTLTAVARDAAGNASTSAGIPVTVANAPPPDTIPPTVSINAPASGATISGTVSVSANAADNIGVAGVQFRLDGANVGVELTAAPYAISWDTTGVANGAHTLTAIARDAAGNATTSTGVAVTASNVPPPDTTPPTVAITAPLSGATVSGPVPVSANAVDNVGVAGVQFKLDGANLGAEVTSAPYDLNWSTTSVANGTHALTAVARDAAGNAATSGTVSVSVSNAAPALTVGKPTESGITATAATLAWTTSTAATCAVKYGLSSGALTQSTAPTALGTAHAVTLSALVAKTRYYYQVVATAPDGSTATSAVQFFNTKPK